MSGAQIPGPLSSMYWNQGSCSTPSYRVSRYLATLFSYARPQARALDRFRRRPVSWNLGLHFSLWADINPLTWRFGFLCSRDMVLNRTSWQHLLCVRYTD